MQLGYDAHGRLETMTQGTHTLVRTYRPGGFLDSITDPLTRLHRFDMGAVGRMLSETAYQTGLANTNPVPASR